MASKLAPTWPQSDALVECRELPLVRLSASKDFVRISELLPPLAEHLVWASPELWLKESHNNDVRRHVANYFVQLYLFDTLKQMVYSRSVESINGKPQVDELVLDAAWGIGVDDVARVHGLLTADLPSRLWEKIGQVAESQEAQHEALEAHKTAKGAAGRLTIFEACTELALNTDTAVERWLQAMLVDIRDGKLPLRNPQNPADRLPYRIPVEIRAYTESGNYRIRRNARARARLEETDAISLNQWLAQNPDWCGYRFPLPPTTETTAQDDALRLSTTPTREVRGTEAAALNSTERRGGFMSEYVEKAIATVGSTKLSAVYRELRRRATVKEDPFTGEVVADGGLMYLDENLKIAKYTKSALESFLRRKKRDQEKLAQASAATANRHEPS